MSERDDHVRPASDVQATIEINRHCLHCAIWAVLELYYPDKHINAQQVLDNVGDVLAEVLAMVPDHDKRKRALKALSKWLPGRVIHHLNDRTSEHVH